MCRNFSFNPHTFQGTYLINHFLFYLFIYLFIFVLIKQTFVSLCLYIVDPITFLASDSVLRTLFSSENSLFIQLWKNEIFLGLYYDFINII